ncbi:hypothetical protein FOZ63_007991, partial [Perkinsus olseni]
MKKFLATCSPDLLDELKRELTSRNLEVVIRPEGDYLDIHFVHDTKRDIILECRRARRLQEALQVVEEVCKSRRFSRRKTFRLTGNLGFDPLLQHPVDRAVADAIRSATGSVGATWDDEVSLSG